jgi:peptide deformylase
MMKLIGGENKKLTTVCEFTSIVKAVNVGNKLKKFAGSNNCLGLSANQFGILERVCIIKTNSVFKVFINPQIVTRQGSQVSNQEGCLTYPGVRGDVKRPNRVLVTWLSVGKKDYNMKKEDAWFEGIEAIILDHEVDHLNGVRCIDKMFNKTQEPPK